MPKKETAQPYVDSIENKIQFEIQSAINTRQIDGQRVADLKALREKINLYFIDVKNTVEENKMLTEAVELLKTSSELLLNYFDGVRFSEDEQTLETQQEIERFLFNLENNERHG